MIQRSNRAFRRVKASSIALALASSLAVPVLSEAGKVSWLDEVVQEVLIEARAGGKSAIGEGGATASRTAGRLFAREADEGLEALARRSDALARSALSPQILVATA